MGAGLILRHVRDLRPWELTFVITGFGTLGAFIAGLLIAWRARSSSS